MPFNRNYSYNLHFVSALLIVFFSVGAIYSFPITVLPNKSPDPYNFDLYGLDENQAIERLATGCILLKQKNDPLGPTYCLEPTFLSFVPQTHNGEALVDFFPESSSIEFHEIDFLRGVSLNPEYASVSDFTMPFVHLRRSSIESASQDKTYLDAAIRPNDTVGCGLSSNMRVSGLGVLDIHHASFIPLILTVNGSAHPAVRINYVKPVVQSKRQAFFPRQAAGGSGSPVITLMGDDSITHEVGTVYEDEGATAEDTGPDPDALVTVIPMGLADVDTLGTYTIVYTAEDSDGNLAIPVVRSVTVVDTQAPEIELGSDVSFLTHPVGESYSDKMPQATDNHDGSVTVQRTGSGDLDVNSIGVYTLTYTASDSSGNEAIPKTRTISVVDAVEPLITLSGESAIEHEMGSAFVDPGYFVSDNYDSAANRFG